MREIILEQGDMIKLNSKEEVEFINESNNDITGINKSGEIVRFRHEDINCIKKKGVMPCGGDMENYWMFYTGPGYKTTDVMVANWARYELPEFESLDDEEIIKRHIYWGTESMQYKGFYNGDTYVLYNNINALPEDKKFDAEHAR